MTWLIKAAQKKENDEALTPKQAAEALGNLKSGESVVLKVQTPGHKGPLDIKFATAAAGGFKAEVEKTTAAAMALHTGLQKMQEATAELAKPSLLGMLKKAHEHKTQNPTIIQKLIDVLGGYKQQRSHKTVHASDITKEDFCPRQFVLLNATKHPPTDVYIDPAMQATFDLGNAIAEVVCNSWLRDCAVGTWRCVRCNTMHQFSKFPGEQVVCSVGKQDFKIGYCEYRYVEYGFKDPERKYTGSIDLLLDLGEPKLRVVELKIMAPDQFEKLENPLPEHRVRTAVYLNLIASSQDEHAQKINTLKGTVLYVSRAFGKKHDGYNGKILPFKEYDVLRDDKTIQVYLDKAVSVAHARNSGIIPARICDSHFCKQASKCPVRAICFDEDKLKGLKVKDGQ